MISFSEASRKFNPTLVLLGMVIFFYKGLITTICSPSSKYGSHTKFKCCLSPSLPVYVRHLTHLYNSTYFPHLICMSFHICSMLITSAIIQVIHKMNLHNNYKKKGPCLHKNVCGIWW
jgi:hypothetical protein